MEKAKKPLEPTKSALVREVEAKLGFQKIRAELTRESEQSNDCRTTSKIVLRTRRKSGFFGL